MTKQETIEKIIKALCADVTTEVLTLTKERDDAQAALQVRCESHAKTIKERDALLAAAKATLDWMQNGGCNAETGARKVLVNAIAAAERGSK